MRFSSACVDIPANTGRQFKQMSVCVTVFERGRPVGAPGASVSLLRPRSLLSCGGFSRLTSSYPLSALTLPFSLSCFLFFLALSPSSFPTLVAQRSDIDDPRPFHLTFEFIEHVPGV